jgi:hypothetical protein
MGVRTLGFTRARQTAFPVLVLNYAEDIGRDGRRGILSRYSKRATTPQNRSIKRKNSITRPRGCVRVDKPQFSTYNTRH